MRAGLTAARVAPVVVAVVSFVVYLRTVMPGIAFGDWGEMQTVPHVLGVAHPTGYPTYILLAWLTEQLPIGTVAFRANLLSSVLVAAALAVFTVIAMRLGVRPLIAAAAALTLGAVGTVWAAATVAEVNPLHLLLVALILHRALVWEERKRALDLAIGGLLVGLAAGNHLLTVMVVPFVAVFVLWVGRRELIARPRLLLVGAAAGLVGLSVYLYIPVAASADPPLAYNNPTTPESLFWLVSGAQFGGKFDFARLDGPAAFVESVPILVGLVAERATLLFGVLGVAGLVLLVRSRPAFGLTLVGILLFGVYVWANYQRLEHYLLVPWLLLGLGVAVSVEALAARLSAALAARGRTDSRAAIAPTVVVGGIAVIGAALLVVTTWASADRSADRSGEEFVAAVFAALPEDSVILSEFDGSTPLWHGQHVRGDRPDVLVVDDSNMLYEGWGTRRIPDRRGHLRSSGFHPPGRQRRPPAYPRFVRPHAVPGSPSRCRGPLGNDDAQHPSRRAAARGLRGLTDPSAPRAAATVVLLRPGPDGPEILLTQRPSSMAFAGDLFVFPGGRVDDADADERLGASPFAVAAVRELFEEAGVLLAERRGGGRSDPAAVAGARRALLAGETSLAAVAEALDLRLRTDLLAPISHWTTPPIMPRRFDTRFFVAELPPDAEPTFDTEEVVDHRWLTARAALDAMAAGEIAMWVPTSATLQQLAFAGGIDEIRRLIVPGDAPAPRVITERPGLTRIVLGSAGAVPGQTVNAYLVGEGEIVVVDPGDPSDAAADAIIGTVAAAGGRLVAIALTHVDPDHAAGAEALALRLELPILAGPGAGHDLPVPGPRAGGRRAVRGGRHGVGGHRDPGPTNGPHRFRPRAGHPGRRSGRRTRRPGDPRAAGRCGVGDVAGARQETRSAPPLPRPR